MAKKEKILIVDDDVTVCKSIANALATEAYTVDTALSGKEAINKEKEIKYDVIIVDLMMPGINGIELLKEVKSKRPEIMVIMITGYPSIKTAVQSTKLGAFDYIPKPFTPNELRSLVSRALRSKHSYEAELRKKSKEKISIPDGLYGISDNSWVKLEEDGNACIGVHHILLKTIEKVISIEFTKENEMRYQGEACLRITDSNMNIHKIWTPVSGTVIKVNEKVKKDYSKLLEDPYEKGWVLLIKPTHLEDDLKNLALLKNT